MMKTNGDMNLPAGFRFHPTDEELVNHYLCRKCAGLPISVPIIAEIDLYKYDPWQLPEMALYGEKEWYFFSPRDRKYPNGSRPNRAAGSGYWKATGADKPIGKPNSLGIKKALVFYAGKAPRGVKTNWIMHEYRPTNIHRSTAASNKNNLRLDDWVLCRIYNKKGRIEKHYPIDTRKMTPNFPESDHEDKKPDIKNPGQMMALHRGEMDTTTSESVPRLQTDSSCSEHVLSPDVTYDNKEVQSQPTTNDLTVENVFGLGDDFQFNYLDSFGNDPFAHQYQFQMDQLSPWQDMYTLLQKPF